MSFLTCIFCKGELTVLASEGITKKVECSCCGFTNHTLVAKKQEPEIIIYRRR